jgi:hypothetical protein
MILINKILIKIAGQEMIAEARTFKTGNVGYGLYGSIYIEGEQYRLSMNLIKVK